MTRRKLGNATGGAMDFRDSTALITGASGGIGEEFARRLAGHGVDMVLVARRLDKLEKLRESLTALHPDIEIDVVAADLSVPGAAARLTEEVTRLGRRIDILINNAGVGAHGDFVGHDPDKNAAMIQLNCATLVELTGRFLPTMVESGRGLVINVASIAGFQPMPSMAVYGGTKAFVLSFTEALWQETKRTGVRVLALCPGATETEFFERTEKEFSTRGRQTAEAVVDTAFRAVDRSTPSVVSGRLNILRAASHRISPRRLLLAIVQQQLKAKAS
jgi:uncharacterized protein